MQMSGGERIERRQWRKKRGERVAAVDKIEGKRKPEDFIGHRNRESAATSSKTGDNNTFCHWQNGNRLPNPASKETAAHGEAWDCSKSTEKGCHCEEQSDVAIRIL